MWGSNASGIRPQSWADVSLDRILTRKPGDLGQLFLPQTLFVGSCTHCGKGTWATLCWLCITYFMTLFQVCLHAVGLLDAANRSYFHISSISVGPKKTQKYQNLENHCQEWVNQDTASKGQGEYVYRVKVSETSLIRYVALTSCWSLICIMKVNVRAALMILRGKLLYCRYLCRQDANCNTTLTCTGAFSR